MNKFMAMLLALGVFGFLGLSQRASYETQYQSWSGVPVGEVRTVYVTSGSRTGYVVLGGLCMVGCVFFLARIRRDGR
jgi:hypothetical protein